MMFFHMFGKNVLFPEFHPSQVINSFDTYYSKVSGEITSIIITTGTVETCSICFSIFFMWFVTLVIILESILCPCTRSNSQQNKVKQRCMFWLLRQLCGSLICMRETVTLLVFHIAALQIRIHVVSNGCQIWQRGESCAYRKKNP